MSKFEASKCPKWQEQAFMKDNMCVVCDANPRVRMQRDARTLENSSIANRRTRSKCEELRASREKRWQVNSLVVERRHSTNSASGGRHHSRSRLPSPDQSKDGKRAA